LQLKYFFALVTTFLFCIILFVLIDIEFSTKISTLWTEQQERTVSCDNFYFIFISLNRCCRVKA